jgi:hypothetical protein
VAQSSFERGLHLHLLELADSRNLNAPATRLARRGPFKEQLGHGEPYERDFWSETHLLTNIQRLAEQAASLTGLAEESKGLTEQAPDTSEATRDLIPHVGASRS